MYQMKRWTVAMMAACSMLLSAGGQGQEPARGGEDWRPLQSGKVIEREITGEQVHRYFITASTNEFLHVIVDQRGVDVVIALYSPDGKQLKEVDSPNGAQGPEPIHVITGLAGTYRLEVRSLEKTASGKYAATLREKRKATAEDRAHLAQLAALEEAQGLTAQADALRQERRYSDALPVAERALRIREQALGAEHPEVAIALTGLAQIYHDAHDYKRAEPLYQRALNIREKALGLEHPEVGLSLGSLASLYYAKGDYEGAERLYQRALTIDEKALGAEHPEVATDLNNLALMREKRGNYAGAEPLYKRALTIREKALGPEHREVATSLGNLAALYYSQGNYAQAEPLFQRALAIGEKLHGKESLNIAVELNNLAALYHGTGDYARAEALFQRVLAIREKALSPDHPDLATSLGNLALLYKSKGDYKRAEPLYQRALSIREKVLGPEHPGIAVALNNLATLYDSMGEYARAEPLFRRVLTVLEKTVGAEHPAVASTLTNLALLYDNRGDYPRAEPLYLRALAVREKVLRAGHPDIALSLTNLAAHYYNRGDYPRAEPLFQRALSAHEKALGPEHTYVAADLNNLATLYHAMGDYARAELLFQRVLAIREKALGPEHPELAGTLNNLSALYHTRGDYARAESLLRRALAIREKTLGPEHPDFAATLHNMAAVYDSMGNRVRAEELFQRTLAIREKALGPEHPEFATSLNSLAALYKDGGDYARAEPLYLRALAVRDKALNPAHPDVAASLTNLAVLYYARGDYAKGLLYLRRGNELQERGLSLILAVGSENQKQMYLNTLAGRAEGMVSLHIHSTPGDEQAARLALTAILQRKGRTLDAMTDQIGALRRHATPEDRTLLDRLAATRTRLATLQISGGRRIPPEERRAEVARLEEEVERLEDEVSRRSAEFRARSQSVTLDTVRQTIPAGAALVEIFVYRAFDPKAAERTRFGAPRYVAYVMRPEETAPRWVELGDMAQIDKAVRSWQEALGNPPLRRKNEAISDAELRQRMANHAAEVQELARALDEQVLRPIRRLLGPARHIILSPDGALNLIPFAALVDERRRYVVENYSITYLTSGRDLLRLQVEAENRGAPLVLADPLYDLAAAKEPSSVDSQAGSPADQAAAGRRSGDFKLKTYAPLPGTAEEAAALSKMWPGARVLTQREATEAALKQAERPRILHVATHGFFLPDQPRAAGGGSTGLRETSDTPGAIPPAQLENPLLRSGLIMAGVNQAQSGTDEDGVLTAWELAGLDLWGTKLVVLSACETGLGDVRTGAGVYGLRRALVLAGSETQVMSLWRVSDAGTRDLMTAYYTRLQKGEGRAEALRQVQLEMLHGQLLPVASSGKRETSDTGEKVSTKDYRHPYYWAAFIQSGDWRSLGGK